MGLEGIVRPVIFPDVRPRPTQPARPAADNLITWSGGSGKVVSLAFSGNISISKTHEKETKRQFHLLRIYKKEDDEVDKDIYVDVEAITRLSATLPTGVVKKIRLGVPEEKDNIEILERDQTRKPKF